MNVDPRSQSETQTFQRDFLNTYQFDAFPLILSKKKEILRQA